MVSLGPNIIRSEGVTIFRARHANNVAPDEMTRSVFS